MRLFIDQFAARAGDDLLTLMGDITTRDGRTENTFDPAAWDDWIECVELVKRSPEGRTSRPPTHP